MKSLGDLGKTGIAQAAVEARDLIDKVNVLDARVARMEYNLKRHMAKDGMEYISPTA